MKTLPQEFTIFCGRVIFHWQYSGSTKQYALRSQQWVKDFLQTDFLTYEATACVLMENSAYVSFHSSITPTGEIDHQVQLVRIQGIHPLRNQPPVSNNSQPTDTIFLESAQSQGRVTYRRMFQSLGAIATDGKTFWVSADGKLMRLNAELETLDQIDLVDAAFQHNAHRILLHQNTAYLIVNASSGETPLRFGMLQASLDSRGLLQITSPIWCYEWHTYPQLDMQWLDLERGEWILVQNAASKAAERQRAIILPMNFSNLAPIDPASSGRWKTVYFFDMRSTPDPASFYIVAVTPLTPVWAVVRPHGFGRSFKLATIHYDGQHLNFKVHLSIGRSWSNNTQIYQQDNLLIIVDIHNILIIDIQKRPRVVRYQKLEHQPALLPYISNPAFWLFYRSPNLEPCPIQPIPPIEREISLSRTMSPPVATHEPFLVSLFSAIACLLRRIARSLSRKPFSPSPGSVPSLSADPPPDLKLSALEEYFLTLAIAGKTNWEMARQLKVDIALPRSIIWGLCRRFGMRSRKELIRQVIQWKLIEPAPIPPTPYIPLSALEKCVLKMASKGKKNWEIAKWLNMDVAVIRSVIAQLCRKLKVRSRRKLVERAIDWKLLQ